MLKQGRCVSSDRKVSQTPPPSAMNAGEVEDEGAVGGGPAETCGDVDGGAAMSGSQADVGVPELQAEVGVMGGVGAIIGGDEMMCEVKKEGGQHSGVAGAAVGALALEVATADATNFLCLGTMLSAVRER